MRIGLLLIILTVTELQLFPQETDTNYSKPVEIKGVQVKAPVYPDIFYEYRIAELNKKTPIELDYNETVRKYIELYSIKRRDEFAKIIGLSQLYFPYLDEILAKHNLPLELKYLTIIESGLDPLAVSKSGAVGLWQFLLNTCRLFDLKVDSYIDERKDIFKSTEAACKYLEYLYNTFNDWNLVIASYNGGPGDVRKAIERSQGKLDYWQLRPYLSEQAQNYVPAFIAAAYLMNYYQDHQILPVPPSYNYSDLDSLQLDYSITFSQISEMINIPIETLRFLNPVYKIDVIPDMKSDAVLVLPKEKTLEYLKNESRILGKNPDIENYQTMIDNAQSFKNKVKIIHTVEKGEFFHKIALKYNCTLENIKAWNHLSDNSLVPGQKLIIWVDKSYLDKNAIP